MTPVPTVVTTPVVSPGPAGPRPTAAPGEPAFFYGVGQPLSPVDIHSPEKVTATLREIKGLGANAVAQIFPPDFTAQEWKNYLDIAGQEGLVVVGKLGPTTANPDPADLSPLLDILADVGDHPALYGFIYLHEPWLDLTTPEMQGMYRELKSAHPDVRLAVLWSGEVSRSVQSGNPNMQFADDLCDICFVNLKPFRSEPTLAEQEGLSRLVAASIIQQGDPDAQIWSSAQVHSPPGGGARAFRVPTAEEMKTLFCTVKQNYPVRGFLWEVWSFDLPSQENVETLANLPEQKQAVGDIFRTEVQSPTCEP